MVTLKTFIIETLFYGICKKLLLQFSTHFTFCFAWQFPNEKLFGIMQ